MVPWDGYVASDGKEVWIAADAGPNGLPQALRIDPDSGKVITAVDLDDPANAAWPSASDPSGSPPGGLTRIDP